MLHRQERRWPARKEGVAPGGGASGGGGEVPPPWGGGGGGERELGGAPPGEAEGAALHRRQQWRSFGRRGDVVAAATRVGNRVAEGGSLI